MSEHERSPAAGLVLVLGTTAVLAVGLSLLGLPSAVLFAALLGGMAHALTSPTRLPMPSWLVRLGQALIGVTIGAVVTVEALRQMARDAVPVLLVTIGTIVVSLVAGRVLAIRRDVSPVTGTFAMIAGGASGVVALARDLGADDRVVTVVQYLRVLVVIASLPVVVAVVFRPDTGVGTLAVGTAPWPLNLAFVVVSVVVGLWLARLVPVATVSLLGPLVVAAVLAATGWLGTVSVPEPLQWFAFALIGVQVGLRFTRASLAAITTMIPAVLAIIVAMIVVSALMAAALAAVTPVDALTAYLATTPGGLFAVLATAADSGSDVTYVLAVQLFRLLVILAFLPLVPRWLGRRGDGGGAGGGNDGGEPPTSSPPSSDAAPS